MDRKEGMPLREKNDKKVYWNMYNTQTPKVLLVCIIYSINFTLNTLHIVESCVRREKSTFTLRKNMRL